MKARFGVGTRRSADSVFVVSVAGTPWRATGAGTEPARRIHNISELLGKSLPLVLTRAVLGAGRHAGRRDGNYRHVVGVISGPSALTWKEDTDHAKKAVDA